MRTYENDISAEKASEIKGTRFQKKNVNSLRQKDFSNEKEKRQKVFDCIKNEDRQEVRNERCFLPFLVFKVL